LRGALEVKHLAWVTGRLEGTRAGSPARPSTGLSKKRTRLSPGATVHVRIPSPFRSAATWHATGSYRVHEQVHQILSPIPLYTRRFDRRRLVNHPRQPRSRSGDRWYVAIRSR